MGDVGTHTLGSVLRAKREAAGLSQEELAERATLSPHAISALERGTRTRPYPHTLRALAAALELDDDQRTILLGAVPPRTARPAPGTAPARSSRALPTPATPLIGRGGQDPPRPGRGDRGAGALRGRRTTRGAGAVAGGRPGAPGCRRGGGSGP